MSTRLVCSIRTSLTVLTTLSAVTLLGAGLADAKPEKTRVREVSDSNEKAPARPDSRVQVAPSKSEATRPEPGRLTVGVDRRNTVPPIAAPVTRPAPSLASRPATPYARPEVPAADRVWRPGRSETAAPYDLYRTPQQPQIPNSPAEVYRPETPARVDTERPRTLPTHTYGSRADGTDQRVTVQPWSPTAERTRDVRTSVPSQTEEVRSRAPDRGRVYQPGPDTNSRSMPHSDRVVRAPEAQFRGPEADQHVRVVRPEEQQRFREQLQERVRRNNKQESRLGQRPSRDVLGNEVTADVKLVYRDSISRVSINYGQLRHRFGTPSYNYVIAPPRRADYWNGYWDGYADGYDAAKHHWHGTRVVLSFYYGYYWSDPYWFAFYYPGYYPSIYHYWGWCPGWVQPTRVYYVPTEYIYVPATPYRYYTSTAYVDETAAHRVVEDVRAAWFRSEVETLAYHLTDAVDIRVYFDGVYEYSTTTEDYYAMTVDAMATTHTVAMEFESPIWLSTHEFFVTGRHIFYDPNGSRQTVYVSYRFRNLGGEWYLVAVGTSLDPIRHQYSDFRW
ncbi:MAG: hypothetical protein JXA57_02780 [Armatimonadetes bacterium]|nr:hypothetical protein [Armatimonadota bacterium]